MVPYSIMHPYYITVIYIPIHWLISVKMCKLIKGGVLYQYVLDTRLQLPVYCMYI